MQAAQVAVRSDTDAQASTGVNAPLEDATHCRIRGGPIQGTGNVRVAADMRVAGVRAKYLQDASSISDQRYAKHDAAGFM